MKAFRPVNPKYVLIFIVLFLGFAICAALFLLLKKPPQNEITLYGNIEIREVNLAFRVGGRLRHVYFEEGDYVKKGEILARLDSDTYKTDLARAKARLLDTEAVKTNTKSIYERNLPLCADGTLSRQECKNLLTDKNKADAQFKLANSELQSAEISLNDTVLHAPNDGIILTRITEPGSILSAGEPVYSLSLFRPLWARAYISEENLGRIKLGQKAYISSDSMPEHEFAAHIGFISPVAEFTPKTVETVSLRTDLVYRLRVIVDEQGNKDDLSLYLRQGMPVNIRIPLDDTLDEDERCAQGGVQ